MQIVIDIPENFYYKAKRGFFELFDIREVRDAIANGTPLPKGHGRLIDADGFKKYVMDGFEESSGLFKTEEFRDLARSTAISICQDVDEMETVIPADKEDADDDA